MMKRILLAFALIVGIGAPAYATELNSDTGCDSAGAWMLGTGWSVSGSKCVGTSVSAMKMLMQSSSAVKAGHRYRMTFTLSSYSAGQVRAFVGVIMPTVVPGTWVLTPSTIADNFTTASGLTTGPTKGLTGPGDSSEQGGAFRFVCISSGFGWVDPIVSPGQQSKHLHEVYGNSGVVNSTNGQNWTFNDFRTKGSSTCGDVRDPTHPINRTGYWVPAMLDGKGNAIRASQIQLYYKGPSNPALTYTGTLYSGGAAQVAAFCSQESPTTDCRNIPTGLRMVAGFDSASGNCGPTDTLNSCGGSTLFDCWDNSGGSQTAAYPTLEALRTAGVCNSPGNGQVRFSVGFLACWDAVHADSPNHRDHMSPLVAGQCPADHPVVIPTITVMAFYPIDAAFVAGKWRLSSDEMATSCFGGAVVAGCTLHADYFEAWSPTIRDTLFNKCIWSHNSCSVGELGDGTALKDGAGVNYNGTATTCNGCALARPDRYVPLTKLGMSKDYTANGTYTVDMTAPADGVWGLMGLGGFSGSLDNISFQEIAGGAKGPVTVHN